MSAPRFFPEVTYFGRLRHVFLNPKPDLDKHKTATTPEEKSHPGLEVYSKNHHENKTNTMVAYRYFGRFWVEEPRQSENHFKTKKGVYP